MACMCAETFAAECGCGSKAAEDAPIPSDPRVSPMNDGLHIPADSPALDLPRENAEIGGVDFNADSSPLPPDPRVSPLNKGLHSPSDTPEMAAEGSECAPDEKLVYDPVLGDYVCKKIGSSSTLIFIDLSGSTGAERADGKLIHDSLKDDIRKLIRGADSETFTIIGFGSSGGDGRLSQPYGGFTRIICESATPAEVRKCLKDGEDRNLVPTSLWRSMGGTRFPSRGLMGVILTELYSGDRSSYPSKTIILSDAHPFDMIPASWDAESFGAESKFDKLAKEIAEEYEEKGKSPKEAMEIGEATAAKIGRAKFGKRKFAKMGKKAESFGAESAFDRLEDEVADEYEEKGMSDKEAKRIGAAVAYDQGVKKYGKKIMTEAARRGVSARSLERRAEVGAHVPTRIAATTTQRGVVKTYDSIPAGDGHVVGQFTPNMDYAPSGMYGAESITDNISKGFGSVLGIMSGLIIGGFAMNAVALLKSDDEN